MEFYSWGLQVNIEEHTKPPDYYWFNYIFEFSNDYFHNEIKNKLNFISVIKIFKSKFTPGIFRFTNTFRFDWYQGCIFECKINFSIFYFLEIAIVFQNFIFKIWTFVYSTGTLLYIFKNFEDNFHNNENISSIVVSQFLHLGCLKIK